MTPFTQTIDQLLLDLAATLDQEEEFLGRGNTLLQKAHDVGHLIERRISSLLLRSDPGRPAPDHSPHWPR